MKRYLITFTRPSLSDGKYYLWADNMVAALLQFGDLVVKADVSSCINVAATGAQNERVVSWIEGL